MDALDFFITAEMTDEERAEYFRRKYEDERAEAREALRNTLIIALSLAAALAALLLL